ncbi:MAG: carbohydrate-binding domain-containing protein [Bacilli bacterium]|nr:carbohydrate-binding domain-containing protein [Bacilli bacterium]
MKNKIIITLGLILIIIGGVLFFINKNTTEEIVKLQELNINLQELKYEKEEKEESLKKYTIDEFETFKKDYEENNLPDIYLTEFLFDGVSTYKTYDLDDYVEGGNDIEQETFKINVYNINKEGIYKLTGEVENSMIAVNSNNLEGDIEIVLNNVKLDTGSKKVPAIYVYNKDITYTTHKVTISLEKDTENYLEGGKLKKISLIPKEDLDNYQEKYQNDASKWYQDYTNYYGIYSNSEIENILFAKVTADEEDLQDADPVYYYKASGVISSDIDLYFKGEGSLEVKSKNKEGIETKGNLSLGDGKGIYKINSEDDCLNTTTDSKENTSARNDLTINVEKLIAIVSTEADEGDAIDSNGTLTIENGLVVALAKEGQDAGLDSNNGTYINGGTVIATGDMYDEINSNSKERFLVLNFGSKIEKDTIIVLTDETDTPVFSYKTDREYTNLVYASSKLEEKTYHLYKNGEVVGIEIEGYIDNIESYTKGETIAYTSKGTTGIKPQGGDGIRPDGGNTAPPDKPDEMPNMSGDMTPPEKKDMDNNQMPNNENKENVNATNKDFIIEGIANVFNGVATYKEA